MREGIIRNPVLPGSHPDPSILRVGDDHYLATSTFEWFPGVRLHHSTDLVDWRPLGGALTDARLLDLTGCPDSAGVWAPNLSYADGLFHLVFSNVSSYTGGFTDCPNLLVTAPAIDGPWSDPVPLHARGFDASLFHDGADSWLLNLVHDWRPGYGGSAGLEATRYDRAARRLVGGPTPLELLPPRAGWIEGPNLYRRGPWYYLLTADGGTGWEHRVTVARSRALAGPYERDPHGPLVTARDRPDLPLQKAGHGSLMEAADGRWWLAYLVARPLGRRGPCVLGRETALAPVEWTADGWPRVPTGLPATAVHLTTPPTGRPDPHPHPQQPDRDDFDRPTLGPAWSTLRRPATADWLSLTERPGRLRVRGGRSPQSLVGPSLVARRMTAPRCSFTAEVEFRPRSFQQLAGVTAYYNTLNWYFLHVTADDAGRRVLRLASSDRGAVRFEEAADAVLADDAVPRLGVDVDGGELRFRHRVDAAWRPFGPVLDATVLSDEHAEQIEHGVIRAMGFTGAFLGLWVWDLTGGALPADFGRARYESRP
ncbi:family 43 glycosylhydrolase [Kitasatospora sp. NPDC048365]|uniref:family 43 glycosylhydrolase n=1 Tax=Kitasatospora sp. NPDC048365 TaxID=3364050 RepID=UPI003720224A